MLPRRALALLPFVLSGPLLAQGTGSYFNVESPQRKPIAVARFAGHDYLVACNTPDDCVEIYDTHPAPGSDVPVFLLRVQTGAEPISVVYEPALERFFTCNFLGDSVSVVHLQPGSGGSPLAATLERTTVVGDEPNHIAFTPNDQSLFVTLGSQCAVAQLSTADLSPVAPGSNRIDLLDTFTGTPAKALKDPGIALVASNRLYVLANRGGKIVPSSPFPPGKFPPFDFDVWSVNVQPNGSLGNAVRQINGLGTTNFGMAMAQNGELWVVGTDAQIQTKGVDAVRELPFGFVQSKMWRITNPSSGTPVVSARDLNADANGVQVASARAISQPTDLALYEPGGVLAKVYVAGFGSDLVGVAVANASAPPSAWTIDVKAIGRAPGSTSTMAGPRGLAVKYASGLPGDPGDRVYVENRLDDSVSVIRPSDDAVLATFALRRDPTPAYVRAGRAFLYGARFSGSGIVSCASCHVDGRSDGLAWNLSDTIYEPFPPGILEGVDSFPPDPDYDPTGFPLNKGYLVTQSLQGMVNFETLPEAQSWFTNEPLHWRGDRDGFLAFRPAFQSLLDSDPGANAPMLPPPTPAEMDDFRKFAFSIAYPPNPEQPPTRTFSGTWVNTNETTGTGALHGMKLFHGRRLTNGFDVGRSCVQCHALPEGSDNKITLFAGNFDANDRSVGGVAVGRQPVETAATRLTRAKERLLVRDGVDVPGVLTGMFGLLHQGTASSLRTFVNGTFFENLSSAEANDVAQFVREMDTGVGPLVGSSFTVNLSNRGADDPVAKPWLDLRESQAGLANCGLAVQATIAGAQRGFWLDQTVAPAAAPGYREEPTGLLLSRSDLLALVAQSSDLLVFHATPLGSERRFAWPAAGSPPPLAGPAPANVTLEGAAVGTAYKLVPRLTKNWIPGSGPNDFAWNPVHPIPPAQPTPTPPALKALRLMQWGLVQDGPQFGFLSLRHDAPRRFRVSLDNGRHGAKLVLRMGVDPLHPPPFSAQFVTFELPIHPTNQTGAGGRRVWETSVEAEPRTIYTMMLGGPVAPNVQATLDGTFSPPEPPPLHSYFDPSGQIQWNQLLVEVRNEDGTSGTGGWQPLRVQ